jgi:hypothetical protein
MKIFVILFFLLKFPLIKEAEAFPAKKKEAEAYRAAPSSPHAPGTPSPVRVRSVRTQAKRGPVKKRAGENTGAGRERAKQSTGAREGTVPERRARGGGQAKKPSCAAVAMAGGGSSAPPRAHASCEADGGVRVYDGWIISAQHRGAAARHGVFDTVPRRPEQQARRSLYLSVATLPLAQTRA